MIDLDKLLIRYSRLQVFHGEEGHPKNKILHIRGIVDGEWVVYRFWLPVPGEWQYVLRHRSVFESANQDGILREA